jgi:hypothetical protein
MSVVGTFVIDWMTTGALEPSFMGPTCVLVVGLLWITGEL